MDAGLVGFWWKFDRYEVCDGWIRPAEGATLERYDPWANYAKAWDTPNAAEVGTKRRTVAAYQELMELVNSLSAGAALEPTREEEEAVLKWCAKHGLLGLLSDRLHGATFGAFWEKDETLKKVSPCVRRWTRKATGWADATRPQWLFDEHFALSGNPGEPVGQAIPASRFPPAGCVAREGLTFDVTIKPPEEFLRGYFPPDHPGFADVRQFPMPLSDRFWHESGEQFADWVSTAAMFSRSVRVLINMDEERPELIDTSIKTLNVLSSNARQALGILKTGEVGLRWVCTSLLSSLAMMAVQDLARRAVRRCAECGKAFASEAYQATYCSSRCRNTATKRSYRARKAKSAKKSTKKRS